MKTEWLESLLNPGILKTEGCVPERSIEEIKTELGLTNVIKLSSNENPIGPPPKAIEAAHDCLKELHLYPDPTYHDLRKALGKHLGLHKEEILVGNGGGELIYLIAMAFLGEGQEVIIGDPSYILYEIITKTMRGRCVYSPLKEYGIDLEDMVKRITPLTKLICVCNPNNPTGRSVSRDEFFSFLDSVPSEVFVVSDEAYIDFVKTPNFPDTISRFRSGQNNMLILRTLSKAQGLAGLRFGYLIAHPSIIKAINRFRLPFNVSRAAQMIAIAALKDTEHLRKTINIVNKGKDYLYKMFGEMGLEWIPSDANFILVKMERKAGEIYKALLEKGVTVRPAFRLDNHIRITVGTENQNHKLIEALCDVLDISFPPYKV